MESPISRYYGTWIQGINGLIGVNDGFKIIDIDISLVTNRFRGAIISTVAGTGESGNSGDGGQASMAELNQPISITIDQVGNIYIVDVGNDNIRKVSTDGIISTIAGKGADGRNVLQPVRKPHDITVNDIGDIFFPEFEGGTICKIAANGILTTIAGKPDGSVYRGDSTRASVAIIRHPQGIAIDNSGNIYFTSEKFNTVHKISKNGFISTIAGTGRAGFSGDGGKATSAELNKPFGIALGYTGNIYITDRGNNRVRKIDTSGIISTIAGMGELGYSGDTGLAVNATFHDPRGITIDNDENLYIADSRNDAIRCISSKGIITTIVGNGNILYHGDDGFKSAIAYSRIKGEAGDGGPAVRAQLYWPSDVALDAAGDLYIADNQHHAIRKVTFPKKKKDSASAAEMDKLSVEVKDNLLIVKMHQNPYSEFTINGKENVVMIKGPLNKNETEIDVVALPAGQYHLNLINGTKAKTLMFVKHE